MTTPNTSSDLTAATALPIAGVVPRIAAMIYDSLLVFAVLFTATLPTLLFDTPTTVAAREQTITNGDVVHDLHPLITGWPFQLYLLVVFLGFFCVFWRKNGQTLGMQAWRLRVEDVSGRRLTLLQCLRRLACASLSILCLGAGYWWCWIDKNGSSWHDLGSNSRVVVLPKKK